MTPKVVTLEVALMNFPDNFLSIQSSFGLSSSFSFSFSTIFLTKSNSQPSEVSIWWYNDLLLSNSITSLAFPLVSAKTL